MTFKTSLTIFPKSDRYTPYPSSYLMRENVDIDDTQGLTFWGYYITGKVQLGISGSDVYKHSICDNQFLSIHPLHSSSYHVNML